MTQPQREALFDLISLATYADSHISLREAALADSAFIAEGWDSEYPKCMFVEQSLVRARDAAESEEATAAYIAQKAALFTDEGSQAEALGVVRGVIARDGLAGEEARFLEQLRNAFPPAR